MAGQFELLWTKASTCRKSVGAQIVFILSLPCFISYIIKQLKTKIMAEDSEPSIQLEYDTHQKDLISLLGRECKLNCVKLQ